MHHRDACDRHWFQLCGYCSTVVTIAWSISGCSTRTVAPATLRFETGDVVICTINDTEASFELNDSQRRALVEFMSAGVAVRSMPSGVAPVHPPSSAQYRIDLSLHSGTRHDVRIIYPSYFEFDGQLFHSSKPKYGDLKRALDEHDVARSQ
jgi:hypothetical protein